MGGSGTSRSMITPSQDRRSFISMVGVALTPTLVADRSRAAESYTGFSLREPAVQSQSAWTEFQASTTHTGAATESEILTDPVKIKWQAGTTGAITTAVACAENKVFVGSRDGNLYAIDQETGTIQWQYEVDGQATGGVAVQGSQVYVGDDQGRLYAVTTDGALLWTYQSPDDGLYLPITTSADYIAFIGTVEAGISHHLHILDHDGAEILIESGTELAGNENSSFQSVVPTLDEHAVYVPTAGGMAYVNIENQRTEWKGGFFTTAVSLVNQSLVGADWGSISGASATDGDSQWSASIPDDEIYFGLTNSPAVVGRSVLTAVGSRDNEKGYVYSHDFVTGDRNWETRINARLRSAAVTDGTHVYVGDEAGTVHALSVNTGAQAWTVETDGAIYSELAIQDGVLYVGSNDGYLYAIHNAPPNDPPTPQIDITPSKPQQGDTVQFDATASSDDDSIQRYEWDLDGNSVADATGPTFSHAFSSSGEYTIQLSVTDSDGVTKSTTRSVQVIERDSATPTTREQPENTSSGDQTPETRPNSTPQSQTPSETSLFDEQRGLFVPGDGLIINGLSAWSLSAIGFLVSIAGVAYSLVRDR